MSKDPILFNGGDTNLYGYAMNDPVNLVDSNGRCALCIIGIVIVAPAAVQGVAAAFTTAFSRGNLGQIRNSFINGFISGALVGATVAGVAVFGVTSGLAVGVAAGVDLLYNFVSASNVLTSDGMSDFRNGISVLLNPNVESSGVMKCQ